MDNEDAHRPQEEMVSAEGCIRQTQWVRHTEELGGGGQGAAARGEGVKKAYS